MLEEEEETKQTQESTSSRSQADCSLPGEVPAQCKDAAASNEHEFGPMSRAQHKTKELDNPGKKANAACEHTGEHSAAETRRQAWDTDTRPQGVAAGRQDIKKPPDDEPKISECTAPEDKKGNTDGVHMQLDAVGPWFTAAAPPANKTGEESTSLRFPVLEEEVPEEEEEEEEEETKQRGDKTQEPTLSSALSSWLAVEEEVVEEEEEVV
jgi:hypothetical protein